MDVACQDVLESAAEARTRPSLVFRLSGAIETDLLDPRGLLLRSQRVERAAG